MNSQYPNNSSFSYDGVQARAVSMDAGLRAYMLQIYNLMAIGLVLTGLTSWIVASVPALTMIFFGYNAQGHLQPNILGIIAIFAPLGFSLLFGFGLQSMKASTARSLFVAFSVVMGISLSTIFMAYTAESIARTFFVTAGTFLGVSLWGYTTKRDLTGFGNFMMMGLIGIVLASIVGFFFQSSALQFAISVLGVVIFTGLTAWDTQELKEMYATSNSSEASAKLAVLGALNLYMDFINLFLFLLRFLGRRE